MAEQGDKPEQAPVNQPPVDVELPLPEQPAANKPAPETKKPKLIGIGHWQRFRGWYVGHKKWSIPLSILVLLLILLAVPLTRYNVAGLALKKDFTVLVNDSTTNTPVSGASVSAGSVSTLTDGNGKAKLRLSVGHHNVSVSKKYYQESSAKVLVPILGQKSIPTIAAQATGRQVKITVKNVISKTALENVDIKVSDITAKTDKDGQALVVLPAGISSQKTKLSLANYNDTEVAVKVSDSKVEENDFSLTPAGKIYFLSKLSGKIDVIKANLDGTKRETVLAGTGREDNYGTVLLASRDWKYLALLSRRDSDLAKLYLLETSTDKVTAVDEGNANFELVGWADNNFVYLVNRLGYQQWQPKANALKSYNAGTKKITVLDETDAQGSNNADANYENFSDVYIVGSKAVFSKSWYADYSDSASLEDNQLGIFSINVSGGTRSTHKAFSYAASESTYLQSFPYRPDQIYYQIVEKSGEPKFFVYANGQVSEKAELKKDFDNYLSSGYNAYLISPSANATFWSESRDGKNSLFIGDGVGAVSKQIATLSDYQTYGWYSEDYLLVSKNGSELYILASDGIKKDSDASKITDYHKPALSYPAYGGGYGGL